MFYLRAFLILAWALLVLVATAIKLVFRPGDTNTDYQFLQWIRKGTERVVPLQIHVEGQEHLEAHRPCVFANNHQHVLDPLPISEVYPPNTVVAAKIELRKAPLLGWVFDRSANVWIDRSNREASIASLQEVGERMMRDKINMWIFPEGRLNLEEQGLQPFKKGAFHTAIELGVPVVPVVFSPYYFLNIERRRLRPGHIWIRVLEPIPTAHLSTDGVGYLREETYQQMHQAYLELEALALPQHDDQTDHAPTLAPTR